MPKINNTSGIEYRDFIAAAVTVATVLADRLWNVSNSAPAIISRPEPKERGALIARDAARYVGLGKTKFCAEVKAGRINRTVIAGLNRYLVKDLDRYLEKPALRA